MNQANTCIFCRRDSTDSVSVEHIVPESLGNTEHTLPRGIVCDKCNNYFSREIEKPLLESVYFQYMRYRMRIATAKGKPPHVLGIHLESNTAIRLLADMDDEGKSVCAFHDSDERRLSESLLASPEATFIYPVSARPDARLLSRFLAKVAIEALALRFVNNQLYLQELNTKKELNPIRRYVREGVGPKVWPYCERHLYPADQPFNEPMAESFQVLHEWDFLYTASKELYFVLGLFGVEYTINLGGPEIEGYKKWLESSGGKSPLYKPM